MQFTSVSPFIELLMLPDLNTVKVMLHETIRNDDF